MNPTVLNAEVPDVIAHAFYTIGYRPHESLVVVGLSGPRQRIGMTLRIDLPCAPRQRLPLEGIVRMLRDHGDDTVVGLVVSDRPDPPGRRAGPTWRPPRARLARDVRRRLTLAGFAVLDMLSVTTSGWSSYLCRDVLCCPPGGRPLEEITGSALAAWHVAHGHVLADDEELLLAYVDPRPVPDAEGTPGREGVPGPEGVPDPGREAVREAGPEPGPLPATPPDGSLPDGSLPDGSPPDGSPATVEHVARWRRLLRGDDGSPVRPVDVRWLATALDDLRFRDAVLVTLLPGAADLADGDLVGVDPATLEVLHREPPDEDLLDRGTALLAAVARAAPPGRRAEALALLAWAAWWAGDGARGRLLAERALADDPAHTLASLVEQLLFRGVAPGWVRRRAG